MTTIKPVGSSSSIVSGFQYTSSLIAANNEPSSPDPALIYQHPAGKSSLGISSAILLELPHILLSVIIARPRSALHSLLLSSTMKLNRPVELHWSSVPNVSFLKSIESRRRNPTRQYSFALQNVVPHTHFSSFFILGSSLQGGWIVGGFVS